MMTSLVKFAETKSFVVILRLMTPNWKWLKDRFEFAVFTGVVVALGYYLLMLLEVYTPFSHPVSFAMTLAMLPGTLMLETLTDHQLSFWIELEIGITALIGSYIAVFQSPLSLYLVVFVGKVLVLMIITNTLYLSVVRLLSHAIMFVSYSLRTAEIRRVERLVVKRGVNYDEFLNMFGVTASPILDTGNAFMRQGHVVYDKITGDWLRIASTEVSGWQKAVQELIGRQSPDEYQRLRRNMKIKAGVLLFISLLYFGSIILLAAEAG